MEDRLRLRADQLTWREIAGEVVAADLERSTYLSTNEAGTLLWSALADGASPDDLAERLVAEYGIDRSRAEADVAAFLDSLRAQGLLEE
jgi:hypothetical protein